MAHSTQQPHPRIELSPSAPSVALTATIYSSGSLSFVERGPRGGYYTTTVPSEELPKLLGFLAENGHSFRQSAPAELRVGDLALLCRAVELGRQFVDDWNSDEGLDEIGRSDAERADREVTWAEELLARFEAPQDGPPSPEPTGYEAPDDLSERRWRVRFYKEEMTVDRYSITVAGDGPSEARARVAAWGAGEIELTQEEEDSEHYERQVDTRACEFSGLAEEDDPYAVAEVDHAGREIA